MNILVEKLREVLYAVLPVTVIVLLLHFTIAPLENYLLMRFAIGAVLIVIGLAVFLFGVDIGITPIGVLMRGPITERNKAWIIAVAGLMLGFFISIAEPNLRVVADQVDFVTSGAISKLSLVVVVSLGIAAMLALGLLRIVYNVSLRGFLTVAYLIILALAIFTSPDFLPMSFDAVGAVTGVLVVPFILALAYGVASVKKDSKSAEEDSFGLVGIVSTGALMTVMMMSILMRPGEIAAGLDLSETHSASILAPYIHELPIIAGEISQALFPLFAVFVILQIRSFHLSRRAFMNIVKGLVYTFAGLVLFLTGVNAGFMDVGNVVGYSIASSDKRWLIIAIGFVLGLATVLAEPAVHVLTHQIETVTSGSVKAKMVMVSFSLAVGVAIALAMVKIVVPQVQLWHFLLPGYVIAIAATYLVPPLFVGIAFDSGPVASGPMTATFILAFAQGAAEAIEGANVLIDGFGVIALVTLAPLIALQTLGYIFKVKSAKEGIEAHDDAS
ncbi:MAG: DUF1538 domain-containing protein [Chloroflexota bacterium]|nr:DUF1538 domain-containing protein [Chloroflexota bacterium]